MSNNSKPADDLRGGTQTGGSQSAVGQAASNLGQPGGTNALSPTGTARPAGHAPEPPTGDKAAAERQEPADALSGGRTHESASAAKQRARDDADVTGSTSGIDADNPRQIPEDAPNPDGRTGSD
jgi:hypothetical protein